MQPRETFTSPREKFAPIILPRFNQQISRNIARSILPLPREIRPFNHRSNNTSSIGNRRERVFDTHKTTSRPQFTSILLSCQYCHLNFDSKSLERHLENCELKKLTCEKCGEEVTRNVFQSHIEECSRNEHNSMSCSEEAYSNFDPDTYDWTEEMFLSDSELTYERLLMLDETIEKKGMTTEQMKAFPIQLYVKSLDGEGSCVICMCDYETGEYVRKLNCHKFHKGCIDQWLETQISCPTCKRYLR